MKFGIFMGPFHDPSENPTLSIRRDIDLIRLLDDLDYDEAWIGEHHSAGWETISSPELIIAAVAETTKQIRLGTGVVSLPYHHPFMVANRMVQLDHMTRGRVNFGVGPGALPTDAYMLGIESTNQRPRMDEALSIILRLFREEEPITYKSDWFELNEALLQIRPYQKPNMPLAVASVQSPAGVALAGKHGASILTLITPRDPSDGNVKFDYLWNIAEESAQKHNNVMNRDDWRLVIPVHVAETTQQAKDDIRRGCVSYSRRYTEETLGRKPMFTGDDDQVVDWAVDNHDWIVGSPDDCIEGINRLARESGGFGGLMIQTIDWTSREKLFKSYELFARYVIPQFQGTTTSLNASKIWARDRIQPLMERRVRAINKAKSDYSNK
jgi:limonene 1,2-monooxygenase